MQASQNAVYLANLCSFSGYLEVRYFSDDFDEPVGKAAESADSGAHSSSPHWSEELFCPVRETWRALGGHPKR
jgi:hypothetical protein